MIAFVRGRVHETGPGMVTVDVGGIGYRVFVTERCAEALRIGEEVLLHTHHRVREDEVSLYGFLTPEERDWFELLMGVSGVGPKGALQILSAADPAAFADAVAQEDVRYLCTLPGVGKKTALRLVVELKDRLETLSGRVAGTRMRPATTESAETGDGRAADVVEALVTLGYNERQVAALVQETLRAHPDAGVEDVLRRCLRQLAP
ncbi:Holliday junction branch migration protein RuvA [Alicyclobacillus sp.]|uniref:Holliday junction branch migration protein RuvA n=1 Tax=Alicyclobacillus sp. TaxID=61169 RepID=UPI0025C3664D|nr:Holliday junction branch migration protein RuvA [Alicyclobacillus sp.]MCL6516505.1 Holliday junction branch migration protein RuvA [Alicyclobacillus sp.]